MSILKSRTVLGWIAVFSSAFFLYLSTAAIRWSESRVEIDAAFFLFARYSLGFLVVCTVLLLKGQRPVPKRYHILAARTVFNILAVFFFYKAVVVSTVAEANILNMTYPVFIALFSWFFFNERDPVNIILVLMAFIGIWLIVSPGKISLSADNLWGLASGISACFAIITLDRCREDHDSETILYFMFGVGSLIIYVVFPDRIFIPNLQEFYYLLLSGGFSIIGIYLLTLGFRYVTAVEGAIISSTRIFLAAILGPYIVAESHMSLTGWIGAALIFTANAWLALRKSSSSKSGS